MPQNEQNTQTMPSQAPSCQQCPLKQKPPVNTHFALAIVAICLSCLSGFVTIALGIASLILSLRAQDKLSLGDEKEAASAAWWAALFGWITVIISLLPIIAMIFFGGAILAALGALASL